MTWGKRRNASRKHTYAWCYGYIDLAKSAGPWTCIPYNSVFVDNLCTPNLFKDVAACDILTVHTLLPGCVKPKGWVILTHCTHIGIKCTADNVGLDFVVDVGVEALEPVVEVLACKLEEAV